MKMIIKQVFISGIVFLAFVANVGRAGAVPVVSVCPTGCDYNTIQAGITAVDPGGTVNVGAGTYTLSATITIGKSLTLLGAKAGVHARHSSRGTGESYISSAAQEALLVTSGAAQVTIDGFKIASGRGAVELKAPAISFLNNIVQYVTPTYSNGRSSMCYIDGTQSTIVVRNNDISATPIENNSVFVLNIETTGTSNIVVDGNHLHNATAAGFRYSSKYGTNLNPTATIISVTNNDIYQNLTDGVTTIDSWFSSFNVSGNRIHHNNKGVNVELNVASGTVNVNNNDIYDNDGISPNLKGVINHLSNVLCIDATNNYWGDPDGPYDDTSSDPACPDPDGYSLTNTGNGVTIDVEWYPAAGSQVTDGDGDGFTEADGDCNDADPTIYPGATEICDGQDNQCPGDSGYGQVDEDLTRPTTCGVGACTGNTGTETCTAGIWGGDTCNPLAGAVAETCNNIDDDCDGAVDDNLSRGTTCGVGACTGNTGTETCTSGVWGGDTCNPLAGAVAEICDDNIDQDCDGSDRICDGPVNNAFYTNPNPQDQFWPYYGAIQAAFNQLVANHDGDIIQARETTLTENVVFYYGGGNIIVTLSGGYDNSFTFKLVNAKTTVRGSITVDQGTTLIVEDIVIE